jgi:hypothetical protein
VTSCHVVTGVLHAGRPILVQHPALNSFSTTFFIFC